MQLRKSYNGKEVHGMLQVVVASSYLVAWKESLQKDDR